MTNSTIECMNDTDSVNIEKIPTAKLEEILNGINRKIETYQQDRYNILSELARRVEEKEEKTEQSQQQLQDRKIEKNHKNDIIKAIIKTT